MNNPPITVKRKNEPNLRLMAMAFSNLYHQTKNIDKRSNDEKMKKAKEYSSAQLREIKKKKS